MRKELSQSIDDAGYENDELINDKMSKLESQFGKIDKLILKNQDYIVRIKDEFKKIRIKFKF